MPWRQTGRRGQADRSKDARSSERWTFGRSTTGSLRIQPTGPTLSHQELAQLIDQLRRGRVDLGCSEILFDLGRVETIGPQWTLVLALLIGLSRSLQVRCRVVSLRDQPANVVQLYRRDPDVLSLLAGPKTAGKAAEDVRVGQQPKAAPNHQRPRPETPAKANRR